MSANNKKIYVGILSIYFISFYFVWIQLIKNKECLVIYNLTKVCAVLVASNDSDYSYVKALFVSSRYRRKGLATYLMQQALNHLKYPIYLLSIPQMYLFNFYTSLGFVFISKNQLPKNLRKHTRSAMKLFPMILEEK